MSDDETLSPTCRNCGGEVITELEWSEWGWPEALYFECTLCGTAGWAELTPILGGPQSATKSDIKTWECPECGANRGLAGGRASCAGCGYIPEGKRA